MSKKGLLDTSVEALMERIKTEVEQHLPLEFREGDEWYSKFQNVPQRRDSMPPHRDLESFSNTEQFPSRQGPYHINDFLRFYDVDFLRNAYTVILGRQPDKEGYEFYLDSLQRGTMNKTEVLGRLRYSPEGKAKSVEIKGLLVPFFVQLSYRIPVLGYLIRLATAIIRTPALVNNFQQLDAYTHNHFRELEASLHHTTRGFQQQLENINESQLRLQGTVASKVDRDAFGLLAQDFNRVAHELRTLDQRVQSFESETAAQNTAIQQSITDIHRQIQDHNQQIQDHKRQIQDHKRQIQDHKRQIQDHKRQIHDHKLNILDQQRRIIYLLEEVRRRSPEPLNADQMENMLNEEDHLLDAFYVSFEDEFRGTREDIKQRQRVYLPYLEKAFAFNKDIPVLDVGCGRGEWLELLKECGYNGMGVDRNRIMVQECRERELDVTQHDVMDFLREQKSGSFGAVTGYHIIEHLPLQTLINLLDECLRVLRPGGMVILETPNPENILVGASYFYIDPTHRNPIYPCSLKFIAEQRGYVGIEILRLHKTSDPTQTGQQFVDDLINRANAEQDFSLIGYKASLS